VEEISPDGTKKRGPIRRMSSGVNYFTGQMKFMVMEDQVSPGQKKIIGAVKESDEDSLTEDSEMDATLLSGEN
jgi:hypothetical protein